MFKRSYNFWIQENLHLVIFFKSDFLEFLIILS